MVSRRGRARSTPNPRVQRATGLPCPKIELHVHLEGTIAPRTLLDIARRNGEPLPVDTVDELQELYEFRDFDHFIEVWKLTTNCLRTADDFRRVVVDYAAEAARHGAVYIEGIFSPIERTWRGVSWDTMFSGYCDGAQQALEDHGVSVRLTPCITRAASLDDAHALVAHAAKYRDRGVVGVGLGGDEALYPPEPFAPAFRDAKDAGLGSVPHAGEVTGPESIRGAIHALDADRVRHGIRAIEDPALVDEIVSRGIVLDVAPVSNLRTGAVRTLDEHPLPDLLEAGVRCSVSTDDPAMFDTDLTREYEAVRAMGIDARDLFEFAMAGALCDDTTRAWLATILDSFQWSSAASTEAANAPD